MSIQDLAKYGRNGDNMMMHVSSGEVAGLDALARANGMGGLTTNPATGAPEAFKLRDALPTIAGIIGGMYGGPMGAAAASGVTKTVQTGDLEQGLMTAMMSGAGSALGGSLATAGQAGTQAATQAATQAGTQAGTQAATQAATQAGTQAGTQAATQTANQLAAQNATTSLAPDIISPMEIQAYADVPGMADYAMPAYTQGGTQALTPASFGQKYSDMATGFKNVFSDPAKTNEFIKGNVGTMGIGMAGMGGQASIENTLAAEQAQKDKEAQDRESGRASWQNIADTYARYGKAPTDRLRSFAAPYGVQFASAGGPIGFKEGKKVPPADEEARKAEVMGMYREQTAQEPAYTRIPVEVLDYFGVADPFRTRRAEKELYGEQGVDRRAAGGYLEGGIASLKGDGMSDSVPAKIDGSQPAALSTGEYVIPADVVSHLGNGSSDDGAVRLDEMLDRVRVARTGTEKQAPQIKPEKYLPA
jgi:hypothetical protein